MRLADLIAESEAKLEAAGLTYGHGTTNAYDEAFFIVCETCHIQDDDMDQMLSDDQAAAARAMIQKRIETRKPAPYLLNRSYLVGIPFYVDERVIVPRSFIAEILGHEDGFSRIPDPDSITSVLDICTGSGCLAILAAYLFPNATVDAVELSDDAFAVATRNVDEHELVGRVTLHKGSLLEPVAGKTYDLIITNPPYVDAHGMKDLPNEYAVEPSMALAGGDDGMDLVRVILNQACAHLNPGGGILCEIGRGRPVMERDYPDINFLWLDTEESSGEVFWLEREQCP